MPMDDLSASYAIRLVRTAPDGAQGEMSFDGYALLREMLDDLEQEASRVGWFVDTDQAPA